MAALTRFIEPLLDALPAWTRHPVAVTAGAALTLVAAAFLYLLVRARSSKFANLNGPAPANWLWGNMLQVIHGQPGEYNTIWFKEFGATVQVTALLGRKQIATGDLQAIGYILQHSYSFTKPASSNRILESVLGNGLLSSEGHKHRAQRRVLQPAFSPNHTKNLLPPFWAKSYELQEVWNRMVETGGDWDGPDPPSYTPPVPEDVVPGACKIDVLNTLNKLSLDILGLAGMNVELGALSNTGSELSDAYRDMANATHHMSALMIAEAWFPILKKIIPSKRRDIVEKNMRISAAHGMKLLQQKKLAIAKEREAGLKQDDDLAGEKDLLSLLIRANTEPDLREDQKLTDEEVLNQMTTFMFAGHETTSGTLSWCLEKLAYHPDIQEKLYAELAAVPDPEPTFDELMALPYLDKVVREIMRTDNPVIGTMRTPIEDVTLPLGSPVRGRDGKMLDSVTVPAGTEIFLSVLAVNTSEAVWGPDAKQFNPDRFDNPALQKVPGVFGNLLSFLGGARHCIGYRFAVLEIKAALFVMIRGFTFEPLPSRPKMEREWMIVQRPVVVGEKKLGPQMPLLVRKRE
ncbi:hypothetical protein Q8F55_005454 [Vanrija albida]|uniref:Cytochrome P450 n=1 Tax=Vanrija albida TaxID=181172 RepID=A0ABR3Q1P8_9TREE